MALTFPILPDGLVVDVLVNLEAAVLLPLRRSGTRPAPVQGRGLIDTGSDITAVSLPILQQLGVPSVLQTTTQGIGGSVAVNLYRDKKGDASLFKQASPVSELVQHEEHLIERRPIKDAEAMEAVPLVQRRELTE